MCWGWGRGKHLVLRPGLSLDTHECLDWTFTGHLRPSQDGYRGLKVGISPCLARLRLDETTAGQALGSQSPPRTASGMGAGRGPATHAWPSQCLVGAGKGKQMFHCSLKPCSIFMKL